MPNSEERTRPANVNSTRYLTSFEVLLDVQFHAHEISHSSVIVSSFKSASQLLVVQIFVT